MVLKYIYLSMLDMKKHRQNKTGRFIKTLNEYNTHSHQTKMYNGSS